MDITIYPGRLSGTVQPGASKSLLHRYLICAALADQSTHIHCSASCDDVEATIDCLRAIGSQIQQTNDGYIVNPVSTPPEYAVLNCRESGTTLRLLLPVVGALGIDATFHLAASLAMRPIAPLWDEMERMGCNLSYSSDNTIRCCGQLQCGDYTIDSSITSQFISALLIALSVLPGVSSLHVNGQQESRPYIHMTRRALSQFGVNAEGNIIHGSYPLQSPVNVTVEADWSSAAFFMAANSLNNEIQIDGLYDDSLQGDRIVTQYLKQLEDNCTIDVSDTPDLLPILSIVAASKKGATFTGIRRLQYKESDRIISVSSMLQNYGIDLTVTDNSLTIKPGRFLSCTIDSFNDHRIAMASAIAATIADGPITILNAQCVNKSYPRFWEEYRKLGGSYAQYIR